MKLWLDTFEEVLGKKKTQDKEWISSDTIKRIEKRKEKKVTLNTSRTRTAKVKGEYTAADRDVQKSVRKDKKDYIEEFNSQTESAAGQGNLKDLYLTTKRKKHKLAGKFQQTDKTIKDKDGSSLTSTEEQLKRWREHFRELLNRPAPETPLNISPAVTELPINCKIKKKPSKAVIRKTIVTLKNGKAAGPDNIQAEAIKADKRLLSPSYTRSGRRKRYQPSGWRDLSSSCPEEKTSGTAATTEASVPYNVLKVSTQSF
jgi:hypothetical protein